MFQWIALSIIGALGTINMYAHEVKVLYDIQSEGQAFAARDIQTALNNSGNIFIAGDISEAAAGAKGTRIIISILGHESTRAAFKTSGGTLPSGLQPEGFGIHHTGTEGAETWWGLGVRTRRELCMVVLTWLRQSPWTV